MNNNNFADKLKNLMKERKISGQKIADAVGVSQKTISRYVTGENEPNEDMQKKILEAIAEIGGHPEDAITDKQPYIFATTLREAMKYSNQMASDDEILASELQEFYRDKENACKVFSLLEESNQKFVLDNYAVYCEMDAYEIAIIEAFAMISEDKRNFILDSLETIHLNLSDMKDNPSVCQKISRYMEMISKCKAIETEKMEKFSDIPENVSLSQYSQEYADKLERASGINVEKMGAFLPELITFDERDWYLLSLVQMLRLRDRGANITYDGRVVGDKIYALINYIEKLVEE